MEIQKIKKDNFFLTTEQGGPSYDTTMELKSVLERQGYLKPKKVDGTTYKPTMEDLVTFVNQGKLDELKPKDFEERKKGGADTIISDILNPKAKGGKVKKKYANGGTIRKPRRAK
jgi:hypothetical protein